MIERERLVVKMEAGAPLLFIIGKLDSEMAFLAKTFGYVVVCGVPPKTGGKYIQLFETNPFPLALDNYRHSIDVFTWKGRRSFFLVEYIKGISYSFKSHGGVVRHERRVGDKLVLPPGRCESR